MKKKPVGRTVVVLNALCAILWIARTVIDVVTQTYSNAPALFWLNALCAAAWLAAFAANLKRYRTDKEK